MKCRLLAGTLCIVLATPAAAAPAHVPERVKANLARASLAVAFNPENDVGELRVAGRVGHCPRLSEGYRCRLHIRARSLDPSGKPASQWTRCEITVFAWPRGFRYGPSSCPRSYIP